MKLNFLKMIVLLTCIISIRNFAQNSGDNIFSGIQVHTINIKFTQTDYWDSLKIYYNEGLERLIKATVVVNGVEMNNVGVRLKGQSSYSYPNDKKSFRLYFDEYVAGQKWDGEKGVHLNNMWGDPSFMREKIHLDFCKDAGVVAPRANYVRLYLNDQFWGLYSLVEHVNKDFLKARFGNKDGDLFKAVDAFDKSGKAIISDFKWYGSADSFYTVRYELKTDGSTTAWPTLIPFIDTLNNNANTNTAYRNKIKLLVLYKAFAADILFSNLDSYIGSGRNFYFYFIPDTKKMYWIVWDTGLSLGVYSEGVSRPETMSVTYLVNNSERPLLGKILNEPVLRLEYLQTINSLFKDYFSVARLFPHIDSVANVIRQYVNEDPRKMYTSLQFETNITTDINAEGGGGTRKPGLKSFINSRFNSVQTQLADLGISGIDDNKEIPQSFQLMQNYPNPFNPETVISYQLSATSNVLLKVYDLLGKEILTLVNKSQPAGRYSVTFDASNLSSGIYFYKITAGSFCQVKKMMFIK